MTAMLKHLRIVVTALSLMACVLLVALWVHSYWYQDFFRGWVSNDRSVSSISWRGWISFGSVWHADTSDASQLPRWEATLMYVSNPTAFISPMPG